jgi:outer membrane receptor protein involved in Fe transport
LQGSVRDQTGAAISGAEVVLTTGKQRKVQLSDDGGNFSFDFTFGESAVLTVSAHGFASQQKRLNGAESGDFGLAIVLLPAPVTQETIVVATRREMSLGDTAASVRVLSQQALDSTAALTLDNVLGQVPGFNLFRRASSRTSNPTSQGVSLRGTGGSGASRAVVLYDGIPLDDPFGGWVYWSRVPHESIGKIEVLDGAASDLYGSNALGGVINILPRQMTDSAISFETSYGNQQTPDTNFMASLRVGKWIVAAEGGVFSTDGFVLVGKNDRGRVDTRASSEHRVGTLSAERLFSNHSRFFIRGSDFGEDRGNGTPLQVNSTVIRQVVVGADWQSQTLGWVTLRAFGGPQRFNQSFSSVAADRNSESLINTQVVPTEQTGVSAQWTRAIGRRHVLLAGVEGRDIHGDTQETIFNNGRILRTTDAGGHQRTMGFFVEDVLRFKERWLVTLAGRYDSWRNFDALSQVSTLGPAGSSTLKHLLNTNEGALSPHLSIVYKLKNNISISAAGYRSFRAPTLNELYRSFRVGNIFTASNENLRAEHATGGETGAAVTFLNQKLVVRGAFFWTHISLPVESVTLITTPSLVTRQRENLGVTQSRGVELTSDARITNSILISAGYQFASARLVSFPANRALESLLVPQVPRHQFTFQARYVKSRYTLGLQGRAVGTQFDDDQNRLPLAPYFWLDSFVSRSLPHGTTVFAAAENLMNQRFQVSRTPVTSLGPPLLLRVGVRLQLPKN